MAGYDLKEGQYEERNVSDDEMWSAIVGVLSSKSRNNTSYKYGFLKAIIDNVYNVDSELTLTFDQLFSKFGEIYWNLILKHGLRQNIPTQDNKETYLEQILHSAVEKYNINEVIPYERLTSQMMLDITHQIKIKCKKYVVGALYEDTNRLFYSFSRKGEWLKLNPVMYDFICKHKVVIEKINYYEWARFLEKANEDPEPTGLLKKIDESSKRNTLFMYKNILYEEFEFKKCFYCGKSINLDTAHVDHFIPWSFIKDDKLWNLVLACPTCNLRKNDKLPNEHFLTNIINRNRHIMAEYHQTDMQNYQERMISYIYKWAKKNGYEKTWSPKKYEIMIDNS